MKKLLKYFMACLTAVLLTAAAAVPAFAGEQLTEEELAMVASTLMDQLSSMSDEELEEAAAYYESLQETALAQGLSSYRAVRSSAGEYIGIGSSAFSRTEDGVYSISLVVNFSNRDCNVTFLLDPQTGLTGMSFEEVLTLSAKIKDASVNLVVGMGTVFLVLIFLCWVISLFKHVGKLEKKLSGKGGAEPSAAASGAIPSAAVSMQAKPGTEDELRAVIAAAIAAYESETGCSIEKQPSLNNGLIIKTYRRN